MKRLLLLAILAGSIGVAQANSYVFTAPGSIALDHTKYYTWGISGFSIPSDEEICNAVLTFYGINNWSADEDTVLPIYGWVYEHHHWVWKLKGYTDPVAKNWLHSWLLDTANNPGKAGPEEGPAPGVVKTYSDTDGGPDNFTSWSLSDKAYIGTYTDDHGGPSGDKIDLSYDFSDLGLVGTLDTFVKNGDNFALGFDPDCHYEYCRIEFKIVTCPKHVPDGGATLGLLALGLLAIPGLRRLLRA